MPLPTTLRPTLRQIRSELAAQLFDHILPFWLGQQDPIHGGFYGSITTGPDPTAPKGLVMTARHLWTFSQAFLSRPNPAYLEAAGNAYRFLTHALYDATHRGFFWSVHPDGTPLSRVKKLYGNAFAVYALAAYHTASGDREALTLAWETFDLLEDRGRDRRHGGYYEAFTEDWSTPLPEPLGEGETPAPKTMNTHLHILEAYSTLFRTTKEPRVREAMEHLILIFRTHIAPSSHLGLYFAEDWAPMGGGISFGHDIEATWLLTESVELLYGDPLPEWFLSWIRPVMEETARALDTHGGSLPNEQREDGSVDRARVWWVQAEAFVGFLNAYSLFEEPRYLDHACTVWRFIMDHLVDREGGEWFWAVTPEGSPLAGYEKGGMWKASYHNSRACLEGMRRIDTILEEERR
ncbi:AGE family epimerase/isomerase [Spirochaeta thermophila]|uniref:Cellobiose 2-epimerase n=2 Tax=Winmispira thermophila (strain ATCC 49972 / DSM 6192 / RI 19.B1) TaxID=665571 RepID=E0RU15_WINT6|nr:AGE family epimerase/isomerase [Spirochaeta thermophila]ADN01071.1 N-acylglucosamine 2-epimerase [Spirochaeta thermophila DSM 6192]